MKATLLAALAAAMVFGTVAAVAPAQTVPGQPGGADDEQYCSPAEAQYGECDDDVTIIVNPPGQAPALDPATPPGGGDAAGAEDVAGGGVFDGGVPAASAPTTSTAVASASPAPSSAATVGGVGSQAGSPTTASVPGASGSGAGVLPDTGGMKLPVPALGALLIVVGGAALLLRRRSRA